MLNATNQPNSEESAPKSRHIKVKVEFFPEHCGAGEIFISGSFKRRPSLVRLAGTPGAPAALTFVLDVPRKIEALGKL